MRAKTGSKDELVNGKKLSQKSSNYDSKSNNYQVLETVIKHDSIHNSNNNNSSGDSLSIANNSSSSNKLSTSYRESNRETTSTSVFRPNMNTDALQRELDERQQEIDDILTEVKDYHKSVFFDGGTHIYIYIYVGLLF